MNKIKGRNPTRFQNISTYNHMYFFSHIRNSALLNQIKEYACGNPSSLPDLEKPANLVGISLSDPSQDND